VSDHVIDESTSSGIATELVEPGRPRGDDFTDRSKRHRGRRRGALHGVDRIT
jgi:hypothetical protein